MLFLSLSFYLRSVIDIFDLLLIFYMSGKGIGTGITSRWTEIGGLKITGRLREIGGWTMGGTEISQRIPPVYGNSWRDNDRPVEGNWSGSNGENRNLEANITPDRRTGMHPSTYHCHHGKSQGYHRGWSG